MKKIIIAEAKFISLFGKNTKLENDDNIHFQDGDFIVTKDRINKYREIFNPWYEDRYKRDKNKILHQLAFSKTMYLIDNGKKIPEFSDRKIYTSIYNNHFSPEQVNYVEKKYILPKYGNMEIEDLYDIMSVNTERGSYELNKKSKIAVANLINNGFFDTFLNGNVKKLALWDLGKLNNITDYVGWLYTKNKFTGKLNRDSLIHNMQIIKDEIADSDDGFMNNDKFIAMEELTTAIRKLNKKG